jgi:hypothetical protein
MPTVEQVTLTFIDSASGKTVLGTFKERPSGNLVPLR